MKKIKLSNYLLVSMLSVLVAGLATALALTIRAFF